MEDTLLERTTLLLITALDRASKDAECKPLRICRQLADHCTRLMDLREFAEARKCLKRIEEIYGNTKCPMTELAIENTFLIHLANYIFSSANRSRYIKLLPETLRDLLMLHLGAIQAVGHA
jgi:hypothetical protein